MGRKLDFYALRYTFATKLAASGVSQCLAQELLRHSDPRLTANIYTDATSLPTFDAVHGLKWQAKHATPAVDAAKSDKKSHSQMAPQNLVSGGHAAAGLVMVHKQPEPGTNAQAAHKNAFGQVLA